MRRNEKDRHVVPNGNGGWNVEKPHASRASSHHQTQNQAIGQARQTTARTGGNTVVHNADGQIRGNDNAPKNTGSTPRRGRR